MRALLNKLSDTYWESASYCKHRVEECGRPAHKRMAWVAYNIVCCSGLGLWRLTTMIPIVLLLFYSVSTSYQVYGLYRRANEENGDELANAFLNNGLDGQVLECSSTHIEWMWWITTIDLTCLPTMLFGFILVWLGDWFLQLILQSTDPNAQPLRRVSGRQR